MKRFLFVAVVSLTLTGCVTDALKVLFGGRRFDRDDREEPAEVDAFPPDAYKVTWRHMRCCYDLCKRKEPEAVRKEPNSPYIICTCKNGKQFRVTKLENKK